MATQVTNTIALLSFKRRELAKITQLCKAFSAASQRCVIMWRGQIGIVKNKLNRLNKDWGYKPQTFKPVDYSVGETRTIFPTWHSKFDVDYFCPTNTVGKSLFQFQIDQKRQSLRPGFESHFPAKLFGVATLAECQLEAEHFKKYFFANCSKPLKPSLWHLRSLLLMISFNSFSLIPAN